MHAFPTIATHSVVNRIWYAKCFRPHFEHDQTKALLLCHSITFWTESKRCLKRFERCAFLLLLFYCSSKLILLYAMFVKCVGGRKDASHIPDMTYCERKERRQKSLEQQNINWPTGYPQHCVCFFYCCDSCVFIFFSQLTDDWTNIKQNWICQTKTQCEKKRC